LTFLMTKRMIIISLIFYNNNLKSTFLYHLWSKEAVIKLLKIYVASMSSSSFIKLKGIMQKSDSFIFGEKFGFWIFCWVDLMYQTFYVFWHKKRIASTTLWIKWFLHVLTIFINYFVQWQNLGKNLVFVIINLKK